ncbi:MAG: alpha/beta hydrolase [Bulleidia sp.]
MNSRISKISSFLLAGTMVIPHGIVTLLAEGESPEPYGPGATVVADDTSPSGYTVHFVYDASGVENLATVEVSGPFNYTNAYNSEDSEKTSYSPYEYENGMYASNYHPDTNTWGYTAQMTDDDGDGLYEVSFPITSGSFGYQYVLTDTEGNVSRISDPANEPNAEGKMNVVGNHNSGDTNTSIVKGHWDPEKQSLSPNMDYVLPIGDVSKEGALTYIPYTNIKGEQSHIGVYTPAGYDPERVEPYKTIYISHGAGGDEQDWFHMGSIDDIMDNYVAEGITEGALIVTMDNTALGWDYAKTLPNITDIIIPLVEETYHVSTDVKDRAMLGLSAGAMTTTMMFRENADVFGYFGMFSGSNIPDEGLEMKEEYAYPIVMVTTGTTDFASSRSSGSEGAFSSERLDRWCNENIPDTYVTDDIYVKGSHDWFEWPQSFAKFLEEVAWRDADGNLRSDVELTPGVEVEGNTIRFAYDDTDERNAVSVTVSGNFQWYREEETAEYDASGDNTAIPMYTVDTYEDGMFNSGYGLYGSAVYPMTQTRGEHFELELTVPGNLYYYDYTVTYADGSTVTIKDPANMPVANTNGHDAGHSLVYVGDSTNTTAGQEYIYPRTDGKTGTTEFVTYTAIDGTTQPLEIYLPYGYSVKNTYKTIYVSHGGGGNEAEWMSIGAVANIMDNLIAAGETDPAVVVTMDNTYFGWDYDTVLPNVIDYIIPYVESRYSVSDSADDRAFCGLSMGSMTTNQMAKTYPDQFRFFGSFSGGSNDLDPTHYDAEELNKDVLYLTAGCIDMAYNNNMGISSMDYIAMYDDLGVDYIFELKNGAHDWGVWRESFTTFAKDYLWDVKSVDEPDQPVIEPEDPTKPAEPGKKPVDTSDDTNLWLYAGILMLAAGTAVTVVTRRRREN